MRHRADQVRDLGPPALQRREVRLEVVVDRELRAAGQARVHHLPARAVTQHHVRPDQVPYLPRLPVERLEIAVPQRLREGEHLDRGA